MAKAKLWHNVALSAYSGACCCFTVWYLVSRGEHASWDKFMCDPLHGDGAELIFASFVLSKIWEWGDTVLLVWTFRAKTPANDGAWRWNTKTILHCYHHATTFFLFLLVS